MNYTKLPVQIIMYKFHNKSFVNKFLFPMSEILFKIIFNSMFENVYLENKYVSIKHNILIPTSLHPSKSLQLSTVKGQSHNSP